MSFGTDHAVVATHRQRIASAERELEVRRRLAERSSTDTGLERTAAPVTQATAPAGSAVASTRRGLRRLLPGRRRARAA